MKRIAIFISIIQISILSLTAQDQYIGLLSSKNISFGTARSLSMSGSFGAMGGDLSVASTNPAGLAIYRNPVLVITPGINYTVSGSQYAGVSNEDFDYKLTLDNIGYSWTSNKNKTTGWINTTFAFNYSKLNEFNQNILIGPINANSSLLDYFTMLYNEFEYDPNSSPFLEDLAFDAGLFLYDSISGDYYSDFEEAGNTYGQNQEKSILRKGKLGEYSFSFAANYSNILYLGASLGLQSFRYSEETRHFEDNINDNNPDYLSSFTFRQHTDLKGSGVNFKFGLLVRPTEFLRVGAAFHSPTKMNINDNYSTDIASVLVDENSQIDHLSAYSPDNTYDYEVVTPMKGILSLGLILSKYGLLNIDYEYVDYSKVRLRAEDEAFSDINTAIQNEFQSVGNIKIGGELNFGMIALRGGYGLYGDPFKSSHVNSGQGINTLSGGFGIRGKDFFFDFGVMHYDLSETHLLYDDNESRINTDFYKILATFGFKF